MINRYAFTIYLALLFGYTGNVSSCELNEFRDTTLIRLLNDIEVVKERRELPMQIRLFRLREQGECDGSAKSCPQETLYIAISTYDELPDQKLYKIRKSYGWSFIRWLNWPLADDPTQFASFEITEKVPSSVTSHNWWSERKHIVRINMYTAYLE